MKAKGLVMRRATEQDIDTLNAISRVCFPDMLRWRGPKSHSRKWWRLLINSQYCDIWICLNHGRPIGFIELDLDKTQSLYHQAWEKFHPGLPVKLYMLAVCPKMIISKALQKLKQHEPENKQSLKEFASEDTGASVHEQFGTPGEGGICWIRRSGVIPAMRAKGVATEMHEFCFQKAIELGYEQLRAMVERSNVKSLGMVKKLGFELYAEGDDALFYRKMLTAE